MSDTVTEAVVEKTEVKTYSEEQFKGLLADKQSEVKKRQSIETELAELKGKQTQTPPPGKIEGDSDDAPMTVSQFRKMLAEERQTDSNARFALLEKETISEVKAKYTADTAGEGLDFDSVIEAGEANLSEGDKLAIRQSKNPAAEKYRRCIFNTPELSDKAESTRTAKLLENVKFKGRVPGVGNMTNQAGGTKDISNMSTEELDKLASELE
jgi:hypothetical protein